MHRLCLPDYYPVVRDWLDRCYARHAGLTRSGTFPHQEGRAPSSPSPPGRLHPTSPLSASAPRPAGSRHLHNFSRRCRAIPISRSFSSSISRRTTPSSLAALLASHTPLAVLEATEGARIVPEPRVRGAAQRADGTGRRSSAPWPPPGGSEPVQPHRLLLSLARARARSACHRRRAVGHGIGRRARDSRNQDDGRHHVRAGSGDGEVRRNAARRDRDADGRRRRLPCRRSRPR